MTASFIIVFIEVVKELPLTMILRPFNFDTLPVMSHELVTQSQIIESSVPAMFIVLLGIVSVILLARKMVKD
jgi:iron(III) transport system permease protein